MHEKKFEIEIEVHNFQSLNKYLNIEENFTVLLVNIRSLNSNFELLETFIENLKYKPSIIICTETFNLLKKYIII